MKKNHGMSLISSWFEREIEQERRTEYRAPSPLFFVIKTFFYTILIIGISACDGEPNVARGLAIELAKEVRQIICPVGSPGGKPCGNKDVRSEADWGSITYIYIYGVTNEEEISLLTLFITKFRNSHNWRIPVEVTFYSDLGKSEKIKSIKLNGE